MQRAALILLGAASIFHGIELATLFLQSIPDLNDDVLHLRLVDTMVAAIARGEDPTDPWLSTIVQGYPLAHHYQHLPHLVVAYLHALLGGSVSTLALLRITSLVVLVAFPWSLAWSLRRLTDDWTPGALAGVCATLLTTQGLFGLDPSSYGWAGSGLTTQLWGMTLLGPAWVLLIGAIRDNQNKALAALVVGLLVLTHTVLGWVALVSAGLFCLTRKPGLLGRRLVRLGLVCLGTFLVTAYFILPFFADRHAMNRSVWEEASKYDGYGLIWVLETLLCGDLFDGSSLVRFPIVTIAALVGLGVSVWQWRRVGPARLWVTLFVFWLLLYAGRPTWGVLLKALPMSQDLHFHRLIAPVHLAGLALAGLGLTSLWKMSIGFLGRRVGAGASLVATIVATLALVGQPVWERHGVYSQRRGWQKRTAAAVNADRDLDALLGKLQSLAPGRAYAGRGANWGKSYTQGSVPIYARLTAAGIDNVGYLYHALSFNADIEGYLDEGRLAQFNLFNVRYMVAPAHRASPPFALLLARFGRHRLYEVPTSGYFDLVDKSGVYAGDRATWFEAARYWLSTAHVESKRHPAYIVGQDPAAQSPLPLERATDLKAVGKTIETCGEINDEHVDGAAYRVTIVARRSCHVLFKVTYHPGWRVMVDDEPTETLMLAPAFVGFAVEPGEHTILATYQPPVWRSHVRFGGLSLILVAVVLGRVRGKTRE